MSEQSRSFNITVNLPMSGIALVMCTGPLIEDWNRRYDRKAAVGLHQKRCDGESVTSTNAYKTGNLWVLEFQMTGPLATDARIAEMSTMLLNAIHAYDTPTTTV